MANEQPTFWFGAKRYGYGWGVPVRWQGWGVLAGYFALLFSGILYLKPQRNLPALLAYLVLLTVVLVTVVVAKGERPVRWRWGGK
jgi:drug/metabolite transporter (DMT)-like permease